MKIAIVGSGISGLTCAHLLDPRHEITLFEARNYIGGHTNTIEVDLDGRTYNVDTGFIVFNDRTYPNFVRLLDRLRVESQPSDMSFGVRCERTGLEYRGWPINSLFAQRRNLFRPSFHRMIRDIMRFNSRAESVLDTEEEADAVTLGEYLNREGYSSQFVEYYIVPMGAAIWSASPDRMLEFPVRFFVQFFKNHGMLNVYDRPTWRVVRGGSQSYVRKILESFGGRVHLETPVRGVRRTHSGVEIVLHNGRRERFDHVIMATHSDQTFRLVSDLTGRERAVFTELPYQENSVVLHTDAGVMPRKRLAWAAWNYHIPRERQDSVAITFNMNILQGLDAPVQFCVSLNRDWGIDPAKVIKRLTYMHPVYTTGGVTARRSFDEINGRGGLHFCGAYWGYGFHEDGVASALRVCRNFGVSIDDEKLPV